MRDEHLPVPVRARGTWIPSLVRDCKSMEMISGVPILMRRLGSFK